MNHFSTHYYIGETIPVKGELKSHMEQMKCQPPHLLLSSNRSYKIEEN